MTTRNGNIINEEGRTCSHCKEYKRWELFSKNKNLPYGKANICKACATNIGKQWRAARTLEDAVKQKEYNSEYYKGYKNRKTELDQEKYYKKHYNLTPEEVIGKKDKGCEACGSTTRVQVDKEWKGEVHVLCQQCKGTLRKYEDQAHGLYLLRSFTIQQAIRKGLH